MPAAGGALRPLSRRLLHTGYRVFPQVPKGGEQQQRHNGEARYDRSAQEAACVGTVGRGW